MDPGAEDQFPPEEDIQLYRDVREDLEAAIRQHGRAFLGEQTCPGKVGLVNQGATCYMNSVLQALFVLPAFRERIYAFQYDPDVHGEPARCIPLQLQRLFGRLQHSDLPAAKTTELTESFGWSRADSFVQHDAQELMRVLFEALDRSAPDQDFIDYLREKQPPARAPDGDAVSARAARARVDDFLDLVLEVQGVSGVEEALHRFVTPEDMVGDNRWQCRPGVRVDAEKGMTLRRLPPVLTLHLKRFLFDYSTNRRRKVLSEFAVPARLDMAPFLDAGEAEALLQDPGDPSARAAETTQYSLCAVLIHHGTARGGHYIAYAHDPVADRWFEFNDTCVTEIPAAAMDAALRHAGDRGEQRGVRDDGPGEEEGQREGDAPVPAAPPADAETEAEEAIRRALVTPDGRFASLAAPGFSSSTQATDYVPVSDSPNAGPDGSTEYAGAAPSSEKTPLRRSTLLASLPSSAYLLLYRRDDCPAGATSPAPEWLRREVEEESRRFTTLRRAFAVGRAMVHVRVFFAPSAVWADEESTELSLHRATTLHQLHRAAHDALLAERDIPLYQSRLRRYQATTHRFEDVLPTDGSATIASAGFHPAEDLALEVRGPDEEFAPYSPHELQLRVVEWDTESGVPARSDPARVHRVALPDRRSATVADLYRAMGDIASTSRHQQRLVCLDGADARVLAPPDALLVASFGLQPGDDVIAEEVTDWEAPSAVVTWHETAQNQITLWANARDDSKPIATTEAPSYETAVKADLREALDAVKARAAAAAGWDSGHVVVRRHANAPQFKDLSASLRSLGFVDSSVLHLGPGRQLAPGEYAVGFVQLQGEEGRRFKKLFRLPCRAEETISSVKARVADRLGREDPSLVRLRQRKGGGAGSVLREARTLRRSFPRLADGMEIVVQLLAEPEQVGESDIVITVQRLRPAVPPRREATLDAPAETVLHERASVGQLRALLEARLRREGSAAEAPAEGQSGGEGAGGAGKLRVHFARFSMFASSGGAPGVKDLKGLKWKQCSTAPDDSRVSAPPLSLRDGGWIVYRCAAEHAESVVRCECRGAPVRRRDEAGRLAPPFQPPLGRRLLLTAPQRAAREQGDAAPARGGRGRGVSRRKTPGFRGSSGTGTFAPPVAKERAVVIHVGGGAAERGAEDRGSSAPHPERVTR